MQNQVTLDADRNRFASPYERALLSLAMKDTSVLTEIRQKITSEYFLYEPNRLIFVSLCLLVDDPNIKTIDLDSLFVECENRGLGSYGIGLDYLMLLAQLDNDRNNLPYYVSKVTNAYKKYTLSSELKNSLALLDKNSQDDETTLTGDDLINKTTASLTKLNLNRNSDLEDAVDMSERVEQYVLEMAAGETDIKGIRTGFVSLDYAINGLVPGTLTVIAGKAKAGKSAILLNMVDQIAIESEDPKPILIISTEMYTDEDISRLIAMRAQVAERRISNGRAYHDPEEKEFIDAAVYQIKNAKIYHKYMPDFNADEVANLITYFKFKYNIGLAVFDYIKMETISSDSILERRREDQILGDITNALKMCAGKLSIPVVTACQINNRSDLIADSDRIVRFCNTLVEFRAKSPEEIQAQQPIEKYGTHWFVITYTRGGGNRKIPLIFYKPCVKIIEAEKFITEEIAEIIDPAMLLTSPREVAKAQNDKLKEIYESAEDQASAVDVLVSMGNDTLILDSDKEDDLF